VRTRLLLVVTALVAIGCSARDPEFAPPAEESEPETECPDGGCPEEPSCDAGACGDAAAVDAHDPTLEQKASAECIEGEARECKIILKTNGVVTSCSEGTQRCVHGIWTGCGALVP
jgi:hypothetical protein